MTVATTFEGVADGVAFGFASVHDFKELVTTPALTKDAAAALEA